MSAAPFSAWQRRAGRPGRRRRGPGSALFPIQMSSEQSLRTVPALDSDGGESVALGLAAGCGTPSHGSDLSHV